MAAAKVVRGRNWAFVIYADHLQRIGGYDVLKNALLTMHVPAIISPCHDQDVYDEESVTGWVERHKGPDGKLSAEDEQRKPCVGEVEPAHFHVMMCYKGNKTYNGVLNDVNNRLGVWYVMRVEDKQAYERYTCHLDQPEKHQYEPEDACTLNGLDRTPLYEMSTIDKVGTIADVCEFIKAKEILYYCDLVDELIKAKDVATLTVVFERWGVVSRYQDSFASKLSQLKREE